MSRVCLRGHVTGAVQGVWFRGFVKRHARANGVRGWAKNLPDGRVEVCLCGEASAVDTVAAQLHSGPPLSRVERVELKPAPLPRDCDGFSVL